MGVFVGISTFSRPEYLHEVLRGMARHLVDHAEIAVCHDGPWTTPPPAEPWLSVFNTDRHAGVATVKNRLLRAGIERGAEWIFLSEDDVVVQSPLAIDGYLEAATESGIPHLMFHLHGPANAGQNKGTDPTGRVTYWANWVGAWCLYTPEMIERCGYMDEQLVNCYDHVEHSLRLAIGGYCPLPPEPGEQLVPDATGSELWLREIPGSIHESAIWGHGHQRVWDWQRASEEHWMNTRPDTYERVFGSVGKRRSNVR